MTKTIATAALASAPESIIECREESQTTEPSQTAQDFINEQLQLEADAREALPYQFDTCTNSLGPLRQRVFACLTCNPEIDPYNSAAVCYSCSISCHGEHTLAELFYKRNFVCDCGTKRLPSTSPCMLRINQATGTKGGVHSENPASSNKYNQNFHNKFCGCGEEYDAELGRGTMFQCLGLGSIDEGGCGEDWWHPECILGIPRTWNDEKLVDKDSNSHKNGVPLVKNEVSGEEARADANSTTQTPSETEGYESDDSPLPPGFPREDEFESFICYKCLDAFPWMKRYAGRAGFLSAVPCKARMDVKTLGSTNTNADTNMEAEHASRKRKVLDGDMISSMTSSKRGKSNQTQEYIGLNSTESPVSQSLTQKDVVHTCPIPSTEVADFGTISLFLKEGFRDHICRCPSCDPIVSRHRHLLEEEDIYEPPMSESTLGDMTDTGRNHGHSVAGSLLERGEAALNNIDRVRAIEGVMFYNHLKEKVKSFLQPFAGSGQAVSAEDIKAYFERLRGDEEGIKEAAGNVENAREGHGRREQNGY